MILLKKYICPICGYDKLDEEPWSEDGKIPSHDICDFCGVEFGYEDVTDKSKLKYREQWIKSRGRWFDESIKPVDWHMEKQLSNIGAVKNIEVKNANGRGNGKS